MARALGTVSLLVTLVVIALDADRAAVGTSRTLQDLAGGRSGAGDRERRRFEQAQAQLEQQHALNGTYAGTSLAGFGVTLVRADASTYCIQTGSSGSTTHLAGPGGAAAAGPC